MAKGFVNKKKNNAAFDESMLIGSISGLTRSNPAPESEQSPPLTGVGEEPAPATALVSSNSPAVNPAEAVGKEADLPGEGAPAQAEPPTGTGEAPSKGKETGDKKKLGKPWEYSRFFVPTPGRKEAHVYISNANHKNIRRVIHYFGADKLALADYLENVLAEHWERYGADIQTLKQKYLAE